MRVLVTGGAGFIGSHAAKMLAASGHEPITIDNLTTGHREAVRWGPLVVGDIGDAGLLRHVIGEHGVEAVMHFAASANGGESMACPRKYFHNNVVNSLNLLDALLDTGVKRLVISSSCATYGVPATLPVTERTPQQPINPYGDSKLMVERALHWYGMAHGLRWVTLRFFNAAGADPEGQIGEDHDPETHLIPLTMHAALGRIDHVAVFGTDYPTPDGTAIRDYVHVTDLADAHVRALSYLASGGDSIALNLSSGRGASVRDIVTAVNRASGLRVPVREAPRRAGDPPSLIGSAERARHVLGWRPRHSSLESMVETAWRWQVSR